MHKKSFLIRDILTKLSAESTANATSSSSSSSSSLPSKQENQCTLNQPDTSISTIKSTSPHLVSSSTLHFPETILMNSFAQSPSISFPSTSSVPSSSSFVFTPNVNPFSYTWSLAAVAMAANATLVPNPSLCLSTFGSTFENQVKSQLSFPVQTPFLFPPAAHLQMFYDSNSSLPTNTDSSSTCSSPLSLGSPLNPNSSIIGTDLNDGFDTASENVPQLATGSRKNRKCKNDRNRRNRTVFTELQLMGLERRFDGQKYLSTPDRAELARALGLTQLQVKTWYQNRRMKWKKQVMQDGCLVAPTKPKGRPKKNSIPTFGLTFDTASLLASAARVESPAKSTLKMESTLQAQSIPNTQNSKMQLSPMIAIQSNHFC